MGPLDRSRVAAAVAILAPVLALSACSTDEVKSRADDARASASAAAAAARNLRGREACLATRDDLATLGSLAGKLVDNPSLRVPLSGQVTATVSRLTDKIGGSSAEWRAVKDGAAALADAVRTANETNVRLAASQAALAIRVVQASCSVIAR